MSSPDLSNLSQQSLSTEQPSLEERCRKSWKYLGYPIYSAFVASDSDFFILRRFGTLNVRICLALQNRISEMEEQLLDLDKRYSSKGAKDIHNGSFRDDQSDRQILIWEIHRRLQEYNDFIIQLSDLYKRPKAPKKDIESIKNWFYNNDGAILLEEQRYADQERDLISIVPKEKSPLRQVLERSKQFRLHKFWRMKPAPDLPVYDQDVITYTSDNRIERFATVVVLLTGLMMLIAPLWILNAVQGSQQKLGVITMFIVVFLGMVSWATGARIFESLAATAAYSAVLVVFLQLGATSAQPQSSSITSM